MNVMSSIEKPLYCHWDTHDQDVLFMNENELDQHLYSHFQQPPQMEEVPASQAPLPASKPPHNVECHWDACHEMFDIDEIMEHFKTSHQEESLHPHHGNCNMEEFNCPPKSSTEMPENQHVEAYVRICEQNQPTTLRSISSARSPDLNLEMKPKLDPATLPALDTPESLSFECHRCMWCMPGGHICGEEFMTSSELNAHIVHHHVGVGSTTCEWTGCDRDRVPFCQRQKLVRHLQVHAKSLDHRCKVCNKVMSCDDQLKVHERQHSSEKPFKCMHCGKTFRSRNSLNVHNRTHTGAKPLVCTFPGCGKCFAESSNLAKHRRIHQEPEFQCQTCGRKFTRKDHLHRHMRTKNHFEPQKINTDTAPPPKRQKREPSPQQPAIQKPQIASKPHSPQLPKPLSALSTPLSRPLSQQPSPQISQSFPQAILHQPHAHSQHMHHPHTHQQLSHLPLSQQLAQPVPQPFSETLQPFQRSLPNSMMPVSQTQPHAQFMMSPTMLLQSNGYATVAGTDIRLPGGQFVRQFPLSPPNQQDQQQPTLSSPIGTSPLTPR